MIVGVGMHATLDEFLDRHRSGLASTYLTRLKVGPRLVDATAVPLLYSGRVRPRHLLLRDAGRVHRPGRRDRRHPGRPGVGRLARRPGSPTPSTPCKDCFS